MRAIINNIINSYQIQSEAWSVLVANTQKALEQSEKERKANEQIQRVEHFMKDLIMNLNNMLTKFQFLKEHKNRKQEQLTDSQIKDIAEFANFVKTLTKNVCSLLNRFQQGRTFEEKVDKEIRELEASIGWKLKEFDKALEETKTTLTNRIIRFVQNIPWGLATPFKGRSIILEANLRKPDKPPKKPLQETRENSPERLQDVYDSELENLVNSSNIKLLRNDSKKSKYPTHLEV
jgi:O6-methylguanine-DNA--protein-cysteine methyltransferase